MWNKTIDYRKVTPLRPLILTLFLLSGGFVSGFSPDTIPPSGTAHGDPHRENRSVIRGGIGVQGMLTVFFPTDINTYTKDLYGAIKAEYFGFNSGNEPGKIHWGGGYSLKAELRALNLLQMEPYWDHFYAFPLEVLFDESPGGFAASQAIKATYKFQLSYDEKGVSVLFVPGSKNRTAFLTVGGGVGFLEGQFTQSITGYEKTYGVSVDLSESRTYTGSTVACHGTVGLTFVPWHYLELELVLVGKYARIETLTDDKGVAFTNAYRDNEPISLNFSGVDLRFGCTLIFP